VGQLLSGPVTALHQPTAIELDSALAQYKSYRVRRYRATTVAGELPGLLNLVDHMRARGVLYTCDLTPALVEEWFDGLDVQESTRVTRLGQTRSFVRFLRRNGWLAADPTALIRAQKPMPRVRDQLEAAELLDLLDRTEWPLHRALVALATNLALRANELRLLTVGDVNLGKYTIKVQIPKTRDAEVMPLTLELASELASWLRHYQEACPALTPRSFLLPSQYVDNVTGRTIYRHTQMVGRNYPAEVVAQALTRIGWDGDTGVHTVRRSLARIFFDDVEQRETFDSALLSTMSLLHHTRPEQTLAYIGRSRAQLARDRVLQGKSFLRRIANPGLTVVD